MSKFNYPDWFREQEEKEQKASIMPSELQKRWEERQREKPKKVSLKIPQIKDIPSPQKISKVIEKKTPEFVKEKEKEEKPKKVIKAGIVKDIAKSVAKDFFTYTAQVTDVERLAEEGALSGKFSPSDTLAPEFVSKITGVPIEDEVGLEDLGQEMVSPISDDKVSPRLAKSIGAAVMAIDIVPGGGSAIKGVSKLISKTDNVDEIIKASKRVLKGSETELSSVGKALKHEKDPKKIEQFLKGFSKNKKRARKIAKKIDENAVQSRLTIEEGLEGLTEEAKLFDNVDEFKKTIDEGFQGRKMSTKEKAILATGRKIDDITDVKDVSFKLRRVGVKIPDEYTNSPRIASIAKRLDEGIEVPQDLHSTQGIDKLDKNITKYLNKNPKEVENFFKKSKAIPDNKLNKPVVVMGDNFTIGAGETKLSKEQSKKRLKESLKATRKEKKNAEIAAKKMQKLNLKQQRLREDAIKNLNRYSGDTNNNIIPRLKKKHLSNEDIENIVLKDGTKLTDTLRVKRNKDKSLASVITKQQIDDIKNSYKGKPPARWTPKRELREWGEKLPTIYELPKLFFSRKGLIEIYDKIIEAERAAEKQKTDIFKKFKENGLYKEGGWFTSDRINLSKQEAEKVTEYYLQRQGKVNTGINFDKLPKQSQKFVRVFDDIIKSIEDRFFQVAKKNGKTPGKVVNYAPLNTTDDIKNIDNNGAFDFIMRKHPSFFSLKERVDDVPLEMYEKDYRKVAARWIEGITKFNNTGDVAPEIKHLIESDEFSKIVNPEDRKVINSWFQDSLRIKQPDKRIGEVGAGVSKFARKTSAMASLGLNYASVLKQALTQIPIMIINKTRPKLQSGFAKAFNISVEELPSLTARKGNIAIQDMQGKIGRVFVGPLTEFDKINAQAALNGLLDKEYKKILKEGVEVSDDMKNHILKKVQDDMDMWFGGMVSRAQAPEAFRGEFGKFINMFIYPLTSQLNGFYRHIYEAKGVKNAQAVAEVAATATGIAYMEQVISNLSSEWSDEKEMTKDILLSLSGNIPIAGQIAWSLAMDQQLQVSPGVSGVESLRRKIIEYKEENAGKDELLLAGLEAIGLPRQVRRVWEGMNIIEEGGIKDKNGKMLAPVKEADEKIRALLRGKYGSKASKDWVRNIGESDRRWFIPQVEFLQNSDYGRKAELYLKFRKSERDELSNYLSLYQKRRLRDSIQEEVDNMKELDVPNTLLENQKNIIDNLNEKIKEAEKIEKETEELKELTE